MLRRKKCWNRAIKSIFSEKSLIVFKEKFSNNICIKVTVTNVILLNYCKNFINILNLFWFNECEKQWQIIIEIKKRNSPIVLCWHTTGAEFGSRLDNFSSSFYSFEIDKMSTKWTWDLDNGGFALTWSPHRNIFYISSIVYKVYKNASVYWWIVSLILH